MMLSQQRASTSTAGLTKRHPREAGPINSRRIFLLALALAACMSVPVRGIELHPKVVTWMLVDSLAMYDQSWYSLTPAKDELLVTHCDPLWQQGRPNERYVIAEE
jgi:hypothetical protein